MKSQPARILLVVLGLSVAPLTRPTLRAETVTAEPSLATALQQIFSVLSPGPDAAPQTFTTTVKIVRAAGLPAEVLGHEATLALQMPDHLRLSVSVDGETFSIGRDETQLWLHASRKKFGIIGSPEAPRFRTDQGRPDASTLPPFTLPVSREQLLLLPLLCQVERLPEQDVGRDHCSVWRITPRPEAQKAMKLPSFTIMLWLRPGDLAPRRIGYADGAKVDVVVELDDLELAGPWPEAAWNLKPAAGDHIETVALSHVTRSITAMLGGLGDRVPSLGPPTGERRVLARHGKGRLELRDGTRVLFLQGTPEEMGAQHGTLMKKDVHHLVERILYGVGVGSSLAKGSWFFGEIEEAQARLQPFVDARHLREMDALAAAAGVRIEEARLANFFPELFHCSGFALFGDATAGGRMFHGRILDYMKGVGLEQNACVIVVRPDEGHAWVNLGYAGFLGSVTAMNEKHIAIGEMGGRGEGRWDGKPMAQLVREVMEQASTIDEAVDIMRRSPRTCEYYYVISDAKSMRAVGIAATPDKFETIWAGESHPQLPHPIKDTVLMSAGDRYETLTARVRDGYGRFTADSARDLMTRPVCMTSNIQSVLFAPDTLDFWVANADSANVASQTRYTRYNLAELLKPESSAPGE